MTSRGDCLESKRDPDIVKKYPFRRMFRDIWFFSKGYRGKLLFFLLLIITLSSIVLIQPYLFGRIIDDLTNRIFDNVTLFLTIIAASYLAYQILHNTIVYYTKILSSLIRNNVKIISLDYLFSMHYSYYEDNPMGQLLARIDNGAGGLREAIKILYKFSIYKFFSIIFTLAIMFSLDFGVALITSSSLIVFFVAVYFKTNKEARLKSKVFSVSESVYAKVYDFMRHIQIVKFLNIKDKLLGILTDSYKEVITKEKDAFRYERFTNAVIKLIMDFSSILVLGYLSYALYKDLLTIGVVVMLYTYFNNLSKNSRDLWADYTELIEYRTSMYRLSLVFEDKPVILEPEHPKKIKRWDKMIFDNITFKYSSKKIPALNDVSFSVDKGERIAVVGVSGSGKSTLAKLLLRMYLPQKGGIRIGKTDINAIKSKDLYDLIKIVPQDNQLINTTVRMNLQIAAKGRLSKEKAIRALRLAKAYEFVQQLPNKMTTIVGPNGVKLSGGEKQRICLARALLSEPEILVLDEATSHLDVIAERQIYESLKNLPKKTTLIAITHRIASAAAFKKIIVMHNGRIEGIGTHQHLLKTNKYYQKLWKAQHKK